MTEAVKHTPDAASELITIAKRFFILEVSTCKCEICEKWVSDLRRAIAKAEGRS